MALLTSGNSKTFSKSPWPVTVARSYYPVPIGFPVAVVVETVMVPEKLGTFSSRLDNFEIFTVFA
jgi:hypothetical protein